MTTVRTIAPPLVVILGIATAISAADMEVAPPPESRFEASRPDVDQALPARLEPPHAELDTWTPADIEWSRPEVERRSPASFLPAHPDVEP
jgi:hypothetical protein